MYKQGIFKYIQRIYHMVYSARCERRASHTGEALSRTGEELSRTGGELSHAGEEMSHTGAVGDGLSCMGEEQSRVVKSRATRARIWAAEVRARLQ